MQLKVIVLYNKKLASWVNCDYPDEPISDISLVNKYFDANTLGSARAALTRFLNRKYTNKEEYTYADFEFRVYEFMYVRNLEELPSTKIHKC